MDDSLADAATTIATEGEGAMAINVNVDCGHEVVESAALPHAKRRLRSWMADGSFDDGNSNDIPVDATTTIATEGGV